jgi:hypothetical protein
MPRICLEIAYDLTTRQTTKIYPHWSVNTSTLLKFYVLSLPSYVLSLSLFLARAECELCSYVRGTRNLRAEGDSPKAIYDAESKLCHLQSSIRLESDVLIYPNLRHFGTRSSSTPKRTNLLIVSS